VLHQSSNPTSAEHVESSQIRDTRVPISTLSIPQLFRMSLFSQCRIKSLKLLRR
jgi:hypothetical protein